MPAHLCHGAFATASAFTFTSTSGPNIAVLWLFNMSLRSTYVPNASRHAGVRAAQLIASQSTPWLPRLCFWLLFVRPPWSHTSSIAGRCSSDVHTTGHHAASEMEPLTRPLQAAPLRPTVPCRSSAAKMARPSSGLHNFPLIQAMSLSHQILLTPGPPIRPLTQRHGLVSEKNRNTRS